ncbi:MAG: 2-amino-4-hydroxy-6-hydroxymethyldihydropteridine diphosphokinase [Opitutales bacterium]
MPLAYIGLGSNLGDRMGHLRQAVAQLDGVEHLRVLRSSPVYENRAVGMGETATDFLNAVIEVSTELKPLELLDTCHAVEQALGRERSTAGWAPRTIDLDLLVYTGVSLQEARLTLPHPRIAERDFVAVPLADLVPELRLFGGSARRVAESLPSQALRMYAHALI